MREVRNIAKGIHMSIPNELMQVVDLYYGAEFVYLCTQLWHGQMYKLSLNEILQGRTDDLSFDYFDDEDSDF